MRLPRAFRTASFHLAALYVVIFTVSVLVLGAVAFWTTRTVLEQQMRDRIKTEAISLSGEFRADGLQGLLAAVHQRERGGGQLDYLVQSTDGRALGGSLAPVAPIVPTAGWTTLAVPAEADEPNVAKRELAYVVALPSGGSFAVADDLDDLAEAEEAILTAFAWVLGVSVLLGVGGGLLLSRGFLHRIDTISRTAEAITGGDLERRIPLRGTGDDLDRLAETLNRMLDRIGVLMESLRQVSTDIAHDLRTPLSRLLQRLDTARSRGGSARDYAAAVEAAVADVEGILAIFAALLAIAQIEAAAEPPHLEDVDLSAVANTVVEAFGPSAEEQGRRLAGEVTPGTHVRGSRELLTQLLVNLVENALRHTPPATAVVVSLRRPSDGGVQLTVEDNGAGIPAEERPLVLRRFYRREQSRTTPGNGLGLSLVAAIAGLHDAALSLEDAGPGLRVRIVFKPAEAANAPETRA